MNNGDTYFHIFFYFHKICKKGTSIKELVEEKSIFSTHVALSKHNYYFDERFYMVEFVNDEVLNTKYE
jgi:hypothetical protein